MSKAKPPREPLLWYLIPTLVGMVSVLFSNQFANPLFRFIVVLVSVALPVFASGALLAQSGAKGMIRFVLLGGVVLLLVGAAGSFLEFSETFAERKVLPGNIGEGLRAAGMISLLLGLFLVLFSIVKTGQATRKIAERFRHLADHISEGFILFLPEGTITLVNQPFLEMSGLSADEVVGRNVESLVRRLRSDGLLPHLEPSSQEFPSEYEITWSVRGEERQFWFSETPILDPRGRRTSTLATVRDVTERNRMAQRLEEYTQELQRLVEEQTHQLRESEEQFRELLLHMNEGFLAIDTLHTICFANNRACTLLGVDPQAILGREIFDFVNADDRMRLLAFLETEGTGSALKSQNATRHEFTFVCEDGQEVPVLVAVALSNLHSSLSDSRTGGPGSARFSLVITDVSEQKRMQRELEKRASELEAANEELLSHGRAKDGFLSNVSHELRTPLTTIHGYVEMFESESLGPLAPAQVDALRVMQRNLNRLMALINEILEFSRMEIHGVSLRIALLDPARVVLENIASAEPLALAKNVRIQPVVSEDCPAVWGDHHRIGQVLTILLSNAVKFSPENGTIEVRVAQGQNPIAGYPQPKATGGIFVREPSCNIYAPRANPANKDSMIAIAVRDSGIGIDPANHARVFDKFYQIDSSMSRRYGGAGIGLSIAKSIAEAHGGTIQLESEIDQGSTFTLVLPNAVFDATLAEVSSESMRDLRALIVSESETLRRVIRTVLETCGCVVEEARNGSECVRRAEEWAPDIVLLHEPFNEEGGLGAVSMLRQNPATDMIPILSFRDFAASKLERNESALPEVYPMSVPFTAQELVAQIQRIKNDE